MNVSHFEFLLWWNFYKELLYGVSEILQMNTHHCACWFIFSLTTIRYCIVWFLVILILVGIDKWGRVQRFSRQKLLFIKSFVENAVKVGNFIAITADYDANFWYVQIFFSFREWNVDIQKYTLHLTVFFLHFLFDIFIPSGSNWVMIILNFLWTSTFHCLSI